VRRADTEVLIYILIEHKRRPERWAVFQLLDYVMGLWRDLRRVREEAMPLPRVLPILMIQSSSGVQPRSLADLLEQPSMHGDGAQGDAEIGDTAFGDVELDLLQPQFDPFIVELQSSSRDHRFGFAMTLLARLTIDALVHLPAANVELTRQVFARWGAAFRRLLASDNGGYALRALWSYTANVVDVPTHVLIEIAEETMDPTVTRQFKPPAEQWRDEGREQGMEQGMAEGLEQGLRVGRLQVLRAMLAARFGVLPPQALGRLETATMEQLDAWALRLLDADALDDVFGT